MREELQPKPLKILEVELAATIYMLASQHKWSDELLQDLLAKAQAYLRARSPEPARWDVAQYVSIASIRNLGMLGRIIKIRATIAHASDPLILKTGDSRTLCINLTFQDAASGDRIGSTAITWTALIDRLLEYRKRFSVYEVLGEVYDFPIDGLGHVSEFRLIVYDLRPSTNPLQIIMASSAEVDETRHFLEGLKARGDSLLDHVFKTLIAQRGIRGLEQADLLSDTLKCGVLQAASGGMVLGASGKIHSLVIGAPAVGKKLARDGIRAINPTFQEAHPSKVTVAGISATTYHTDGGWTSKAGYIPLAHQGAFVIQDYHSVETQRKKIQGVLSMAMEDGVIEDSTAARKTHMAQTAIHLDLNKISDLSPQLLDKIHRLDDIKMPMHLLSRFDFIVDIKRDTARQMAVALAMYSSLTSTLEMLEESDESRQLRLLIAYLRTAHAAVSFGPAVREYMRLKHGELMEKNRAHIERLPWLSDFQTRTAVSIAKFTAAAARLADRSDSRPEDVDLILPFVARKYEFLGSLWSQLIVPDGWDKRRGLRDRRTLWLLGAFAGRADAKVSEVVEKARLDLGEVLARKTIYRILEELVASGVIKRAVYGSYDFSDVKKGEEVSDEPSGEV